MGKNNYECVFILSYSSRDTSITSFVNLSPPIGNLYPISDIEKNLKQNNPAQNYPPAQNIPPSILPIGNLSNIS